MQIRHLLNMSLIRLVSILPNEQRTVTQNILSWCRRSPEGCSGTYFSVFSVGINNDDKQCIGTGWEVDISS